MITSIAANHAKGKSAQDKIFGANACLLYTSDAADE